MFMMLHKEIQSIQNKKIKKSKLYKNKNKLKKLKVVHFNHKYLIAKIAYSLKWTNNIIMKEPTDSYKDRKLPNKRDF